MYLKTSLYVTGYLPVQKVQPAYKSQNRTRYNDRTPSKPTDFAKVLTSVLHSHTDSALCRQTAIPEKD